MSDEMRNNDGYPQFSQSIVNNFGSIVTRSTPLFTTNAEGLFEEFLANLPEESRQHYTCNTCKHFVRHFGGLVSISENGEMKPVMWSDDVPEFFKKSVLKVKRLVMKAKVTGVFYSGEQVLGTPITTSGGEVWEHMSVTLPSALVHRSALKTPGQLMAEKHEDFKMLISGLLEYSLPTVEQAITLLKSETLYRSDKVLGVAEWFKKLIENRSSGDGSRRNENVTWLAVATAPVGFCHIKSSMIGTLLDDISAGLDYSSISRRFAEKMNPLNYMRSTVAPTQSNIEQAEKIVEKLGIASSLQRRYATFEEIREFIWKSKVVAPVTTKTGKVFGNVASKEKVVQSSNAVDLPTTTMTWAKFARTVLPTADKIEAKVDNSNRLMALVTAADETAPNILQWDNTFSWYYHGGVDGEIKRRVESAGGQYENNEIRCSLIWEGYTDLDLHCETPSREHIYYAHKRDKYNGWLDIDANGGGGRTTTPVENMRWSIAPGGHYHFYVHNFCERGDGRTPYKVELQIGSQTYAYHGVASSTGYQKTIFEFIYVKGQTPVIANSSSYSSENKWNLSTEFVKVTGVVNSPNMWGENPIEHSGQHVFFLLDGCKDLSEGKGRGFFNEMLKSDLREVRKTLESYTANTPIEDADKASACGLGYSKDSEWNLILKVTSNNSSRLVKIDRWD